MGFSIVTHYVKFSRLKVICIELVFFVTSEHCSMIGRSKVICVEFGFSVARWNVLRCDWLLNSCLYRIGFPSIAIDDDDECIS